MNRLLRSLILVPSLILLIGVDRLSAQEVVVSGYVTDADNGEALVGTNLYEIYIQSGTTTNQYGFFSLTVPGDSAVIRFSYQGYETLTLVFYAPLQELQQVEMKPAIVEYDSLLVVEAGEYEGLHQQVQMSNVKISMAEVKALPALLGETDLLKTFQLMPGIQSGVEGSTGLYVRGGTPGQTLILLDGATVYNAGHLFGFMSTFNTDAINSAELFKGGFPARYGGRLVGVLDITMREGNRKEFEGRGAAGLLASRITVEGPLIRDKSSFIISARRTYLDAINWTIQKLQGADYLLGYHFYDVNAKWNLDISRRDRIYMSFYAGRDKGYEIDNADLGHDSINRSKFTIGWSNATMTFRWNWVMNSRMFANSMVLFSRFRSGILDQYSTEDHFISKIGDGYKNGLTDFSIKTDLEYFPHQDHQIRFGAMGTRHLFLPSVQSRRELDTELDIDTTTVISLEVATSEWSAYAEDEITLNQQLKTNVGIHFSGYHVDGTVYTSVQPRLSTSLLLFREWAFKFSFAQMKQYIQLLSNSGTDALPTDLWLPSTARIPPQNAWQVAAGFARTIDSQALDISLETYYKNVSDVIAYREGSNFVGSNEDWENTVTNGRGWAYGTEFHVRRTQGKTTGWISYTLLWSKRRFADLNAGEVFPHRYDRRHDISIALIRDWRSREIAITWVYSTGHALTLAHSRYRHDGELIDVYGAWNSYRTPSYHRLDLSMRRPNPAGKRSEVIISLYNVYSRRNTFYVGIDDYSSLDPYTGYYKEGRAIKGFTLFPIIPSVSYRFYF